MQKLMNTDRCIHVQLQLQATFHTFNSVLRGELFAVLLEMQDNLCSLLNAAGFSDFIQSRAEGDNEEDIFVASRGGIYLLMDKKLIFVFVSHPSEDHLYPGVSGSAERV